VYLVLANCPTLTPTQEHITWPSVVASDLQKGPNPCRRCQRRLKTNPLVAGENEPPRWSWFLGGGRGDAAEVAVLEPVGVALEGDDVGVVDQSVDHRITFTYATFEGEAVFSGATFRGEVLFVSVTFAGEANFAEAVFEGGVVFDFATFEDRAVFYGATFRDRAWFHEVTFETLAGFSRATFQADVGLDQATFIGDAVFWEATFEEARELGPILVRRQLNLIAATFKQRVEIQAAAATLCVYRTRFPAGASLRLRWAQVLLDQSNLAAPSILAGVPPFQGLDEDRFAKVWRRLPPAGTHDGRPRLLSLRHSDVAGLTIANADLRACRFLGAHNLDKLRIEGEGSLGSTPRPSGFSLGRGGLLGGWTTRLTIAEEQHWRAEHGREYRRQGWYGSESVPPDWLDDIEMATSSQIAGLYRALRKGREDAKDEPGAADFYYGEMEMRRQARHEQAKQGRREGNWGWWAAARIEHAILWVYWLVSGYALRAWRTFATLLLLIVITAGIFATVGFKPPTSPQIVPVDVSLGRAVYERRDVPRPSWQEQLPEALMFSAESTVSVLRPPDRPLRLPGRLANIVMRIIGPFLFGLLCFQSAAG
jgi:uncharacterized protein YjbI with pentapeptide repeats